MLNTTFNNISVLSWRSVLLLEETGVPGENHWPVACHWQTLSHNVVSNLRSVLLIGTDCIAGYKSNSHTITAMTLFLHSMPDDKWKIWKVEMASSGFLQCVTIIVCTVMIIRITFYTDHQQNTYSDANMFYKCSAYRSRMYLFVRICNLSWLVRFRIY